MISRVTGIGIVLTVLAVASLAGCGVRGALDGPSGKSSSGGKLTAPAKVGEPAEKPPHRPFVLDGLIR